MTILPRVRWLHMSLLMLIAALLLAACGSNAAPAASTGSTAAPASGGAVATAAPAGAVATTAPAGAAATAAPAAETAAAPTPSPTPGVVSAPVEGKTNITWWTSDNTAFVQANTVLMKRFMKDNPDINIVYTTFPYDVLINKLQTAYASSTEPDVQQMFGTWVTDYAKKGLLAELPMTKAELEDLYWPAALGAYVWEGKAYGIPHEYNLENGGMLVNVKQFKDAGLSYPKTWDELVTDGKKLTVWKGDTLDRSGFAFTNNDSITFMLLSFILQQGATYWDKDGVHVNFNTPEAKKAWLFETGLETQEKLTQEKAYTGQDSFDVFFQNKAAMGYRGPWVIGVANDTYPDMKYPGDYDYVPVPSFGDKPPAFAESGWGEVVSARSKNKDAAFKFVQFFTKIDNARDWNVPTYTVPSLKALKDDKNILATAPALKTSFDALQYGQWVGPVQNRDRFWQIIHDHYTAVVLGKEKAEDSPAKITTEINNMIDEYVGP